MSQTAVYLTGTFEQLVVNHNLSNLVLQVCHHDILLFTFMTRIYYYIVTCPDAKGDQRLLESILGQTR